MLQEAARRHNILDVWERYRSLDEKGLLRILGPPHFDPIMRMIVFVLKEAGAETKWSSEQMHAIEELAFACAGAGFTEALRRLLLLHLKRKDSRTVLNLYERFDQTILEMDTSAADAMVEEDDEFDMMNLRFDKPSLNRSDIPYILVLAIAAHALQDSFQNALNMYLKRGSYRFVSETIKCTFEDLKQSGDLERKTQAYCEALGMAALVQRPEAFKAHVRNLSKESTAVKRLKRLDKLVNTVLNGFVGPFPWAVFDEASKSPARPVVVPEKIWAYLLTAYVGLRREDIAGSLWDRVSGLGVVPGTTMWNALLEGYRDTQNVKKLLNTWELMKKMNIRFDAESYGAKIICLFQERLKNPPLKAFDDFKRAIPRSEETKYVYNAVLNGLLSQDDIKTAMKLLGEMATEGPAPDTVTYNILIKYYGRKGDLKGIAGIVNKLTENGVEPDVFTFTTILTTMLHLGVPNASQRLLDVMKSMGVEQNVATYSAIIDDLVRHGTKDGVRSAWEILQRMETIKTAQPNEVTYTSFLAGVHRSQELDKELITAITRDIVGKMEKSGVRIKRGTYHILLKACLENPSADGLAFFMEFYSAMLRKRLTFAHDTWYIILGGLLRRGEVVMAGELMDQMLKSGFQPMHGVMDMVLRIRRLRRF